MGMLHRTPMGLCWSSAVLAFLVASNATAGYLAMNSESFSYCATSTACFGSTTCQDHLLDEETCQSYCFDGGGCESSGTLAGVVWSQFYASGSSGWWSGDIGYPDSNLQAVGELESPDLLTLTVASDLVDETAHAELAVFRFDGDPNDVDGLQFESVDDLVDLGIIDSGDILYVQSEFPFEYTEVDLEIDVSGVPASVIVVMVAGDGAGHPNYVPAVSPWVAVGLGLALAGLGTAVLRRRRRKN